MNKTWSVILIVVASILVLGGSFWYLSTQRLSPDTLSTTPAVILDPLPLEKEVPVVQKVDPPQEVLPPVNEEPPQVSLRPLPKPVAPLISQTGTFSLPTLLFKGEDSEPIQVGRSSVLAPIGKEVQPTLKQETLQPLTPLQEEIQISTYTEQPQPELVTPIEEEADEVVIQEVEIEESISEPVLSSIEQVPRVEELVLPQSEPLLQEPFFSEIPTPFLEETEQNEYPLELDLSVSFLDYTLARPLSSTKKGFNVSISLMQTPKPLGLGVELELAKRDSGSESLQFSLLGKATAQVGKGVVTFPLSISLGPSLLYNPSQAKPEFALMGKLGFGVRYEISDTFRIFYAVGAGATYFFDSQSFKFTVEPMRIGIGFSF